MKMILKTKTKTNKVVILAHPGSKLDHKMEHENENLC